MRAQGFTRSGHLGRKGAATLGSAAIPRIAKIFAALALLTGVLVYAKGGLPLVQDRVGVALDLLLRVAPLIVGALVLAEFLQRLVPTDRMRRWLGARSGVRGLALAALAGAATPGGPFAAFPLVLAFQRAGADLGACVAYVTAWSVLGFHRVLVFELPLLGPDFVWLRLLVSLPMPILAGAAARSLGARLPERPGC